MSIRSVIPALPRKMVSKKGCQTCGKTGGKLTYKTDAPKREGLPPAWMCDECIGLWTAVSLLIDSRRSE